MTFPEQIRNVPPELVSQGWRRKPTLAERDAWSGHGTKTVHRWEVFAPRSLDFELWRPVTRLRLDYGGESPIVYAHEGWGAGLSPTPEMVKVWKWWWISREDGPQAVKVAPSGAVYQGVFGWTEIVAEDQALFLGPVLPPVRQS